MKQNDLQVSFLIVRNESLSEVKLKISRYQAIEVSNNLWPPGGIFVGKL